MFRSVACLQHAVLFYSPKSNSLANGVKLYHPYIVAKPFLGPLCCSKSLPYENGEGRKLIYFSCHTIHTSTHSARASPVSLCTSAFRAALLLPIWPRNTRCTLSAARSDASHFRLAKRRNSLRFVPRHISLCASSMPASLAGTRVS